MKPVKQPENDKVFVFGSLRRGFPLHIHLRRHGASLLGIGVIHARWQQEVPYPGAAASRCSLDKIQGEIYRLKNPEEDLRVLDALEEIDPHRPAMSLYIRRLMPVHLPTGKRFSAWAYLLPAKPTHRRLITGSYTAAGPLFSPETTHAT
jgi:gamma-glutamylcyclotransferase (GGCT)/AIG2-like uncharacterized protein YtfP